MLCGRAGARATAPGAAVTSAWGVPQAGERPGPVLLAWVQQSQPPPKPGAWGARGQSWAQCRVTGMGLCEREQPAPTHKHGDSRYKTANLLHEGAESKGRAQLRGEVGMSKGLTMYRGQDRSHSGRPSGAGDGWGRVGVEPLVRPLLREQAQPHGVHGFLQPRLLRHLHRVVIGLWRGGRGQGVLVPAAALGAPSQPPSTRLWGGPGSKQGSYDLINPLIRMSGEDLGPAQDSFSIGDQSNHP